jgi:hypothetical protein
VIQTDNGAEFESRSHYDVLDRGIGHVCIKPATQRLNGRSSGHIGSIRRTSTGCWMGS